MSRVSRVENKPRPKFPFLLRHAFLFRGFGGRENEMERAATIKLGRIVRLNFPPQIFPASTKFTFKKKFRSFTNF